MNDSFSMSSVQSVSNLNRQREQNICIDRLSVDAVLQRHAIEKFHGNERLPVLLADVVNRADVVVIQRGCGLRFTLKPLQRLRVPGHVLRQELQRDEAVKPRVFGFVNDTPIPPPPSFSTMR
jgi:hypothetical protein